MEIMRLALYKTIPRTLYIEEETEILDRLSTNHQLFLLIISGKIPGGGTSSHELCGYVRPKSLVFEWFWSVKGYTSRPFWSEILIAFVFTSSKGTKVE